MKRIFVTNRPNYCHKRFAEVVGCKFYHVKHFVPENIPGISLPINGKLNSFRLEDADLFFAESIMDYYPVYYKNTRSKKIILLAEDTLWKMDEMPALKRNYILKLFRSSDGFIAISKSMKDVLLKYVKKPVKIAYPFPHKEFFHVISRADTKNVLFIGRNDPRKGFPELVDAIKILRKTDPEWKLYLIGGCSESVVSEEGIYPLGYVKDMEPYIKMCTYFVHPALKDATTPATIFEAMSAGIITVVSNQVGQDEIFRENNLRSLILENNMPETIAEKLLKLSKLDKRKLSSRLKRLSRDFTEEKRLKIFKEEFESLVDEI